MQLFTISRTRSNQLGGRLVAEAGFPFSKKTKRSSNRQRIHINLKDKKDKGQAIHTQQGPTKNSDSNKIDQRNKYIYSTTLREKQEQIP
jgi:hypothetical protein